MYYLKFRDSTRVFPPARVLTQNKKNETEKLADRKNEQCCQTIFSFALSSGCGMRTGESETKKIKFKRKLQLVQ